MILEIKTLGVYNLPWECWHVYIGQTRPSAVSTINTSTLHSRQAGGGRAQCQQGAPYPATRLRSCPPKPNTWTRSSVKQSKSSFQQHERGGLPDLGHVMETSHSLPEGTEKTKQENEALLLPYFPQLALHLSQSLQCHCISISYTSSIHHFFILMNYKVN
jgi:hypothetical protein